jgi:hypothetical protein
MADRLPQGSPGPDREVFLEMSAAVFPQTIYAVAVLYRHVLLEGRVAIFCDVHTVPGNMPLDEGQATTAARARVEGRWAERFQRPLSDWVFVRAVLSLIVQDVVPGGEHVSG